MRVKETSKETYINRIFVKEGPTLQAVRQALRADGKEGIQVSPYEGKILQALIKMTQAKKVVEVGTLYGYSTLAMAEALPPEGSIFTIDNNREHYEKAKKLLKDHGDFSKIRFCLGSGRDVLEELKKESPFDMIFIDADKAGYDTYLDWTWDHIKRGGLIVGDNSFLFGHLVGEPSGQEVSNRAKKAMAHFNERLAESPRFFSFLIPTSEGLTVAYRLK